MDCKRNKLEIITQVKRQPNREDKDDTNELKRW